MKVLFGSRTGKVSGLRESEASFWTISQASNDVIVPTNPISMPCCFHIFIP